MSLSPIIGFGGGPVLDYAGLKPVAMTSPCPFTQWELLYSGGTYVDVTSGAGRVRFTVQSGVPPATLDVGGYARVRMIAHAQNGVVNVQVSDSGGSGMPDVSNYSVYTQVRVPPSLNPSDHPYLGATRFLPSGSWLPSSSWSFDVPYYRYQFTCSGGLHNAPGMDRTGRWVQLDFTLA